MAKQILTGLDLLALPSLTTPKTGSVGFGAKSDGLYQKIGTAEEKLLTTNESSYIPLVVGTQTATTASWTGVLDADSLKSGQTIRYWLPRTSASNVTLNLTLKGGTTTGAIPCYYGGTTRLTTHYPAGSFIMMTYLKDALINGTAYTGWWAKANYVDGTESYTVRWNVAIKAGVQITQYKLLVQGSNGRYYPTTVGNTTAGTKTISTVPFLIGSPIIFYSRTTAVAAGGVTSSSYNYTGITTSNTTYAWNKNSGWRANEDVYLKGTVSGALFTLDNTTLTSHMTQDLPTTEDGFYYMRLGMFSNTTTGFRLSLQHPVYYFADGELQSLNTSNGADWEEVRNKPDTFTPSSHKHPTTDITGLGNIATINKNSSTANYLRGDGTWVTPPNKTYGAVTTSANGLMTAADKVKLNGIATEANKYSLPTASSSTLGGVKIGSRLTISSGTLSANVQSDNNFTTTLKNKLDGIAKGATNLSLGTSSTTAYRGDRGNAAYTHITDAVKHITAAERTSWNDKYTKSETNSQIELSKSTNHGYRYKYTLQMYGDHDKYYPFVIAGGDQNVKRDILIKRSYSEKHPPEWNSATHGGGLTLKLKANFGGWGGANYGWEVHELEEMYNPTFGGCSNTTSNMTFSIMLRGGGTGGAVYHIYSDQPIENTHSVHLDGDGKTSGNFPQVFYNSDVVRSGTSTSTWTMPAPLTTPKAEDIRRRKFIKLVQDIDTLVGKTTGISSLNITGNAATASKLGTKTVGSTQLPFYLNAGTATAITQANLRIGLFGATAIGSSTKPIYIAKNGVPTASTSFGGVTGIGTASPLMDGTVAVGTSTLASRQDHRHPIDTSRAAVGQTMYIGTTAVKINRASGALALSGISTLTMSGALSGATTITATTSVKAPKVSIGSKWSLELSGTELQFKYGGVIKQRMLSDGTFAAEGGISALGLGDSGSSGGGVADMLDSWANYTAAKANYYVPASLGMGLYNDKANKSDFKVVTSLPASPTAGVFYFIKE